MQAQGCCCERSGDLAESLLTRRQEKVFWSLFVWMLGKLTKRTKNVSVEYSTVNNRSKNNILLRRMEQQKSDIVFK